MDVNKEVEEMLKLKQKERNRAYYLKNKAKRIAKQTEYNNAHKKELALYQKKRRLSMMKCNYCGKYFDEPGYILKYHKKYYCDDRCLAKELLFEVDDEIENYWYDTPENMEICAKESTGIY